MTARFNAELADPADRHNANLAKQAAEFDVQIVSNQSIAASSAPVGIWKKAYETDGTG
jgi:hypothetical protein